MGNSYSQENLEYEKNSRSHNSDDKNQNFREDMIKEEINLQENKNFDAEDDSSSINSETEREPLDSHLLENIDKINFRNNQSYSFFDYSDDFVGNKDHSPQNFSMIFPNYDDTNENTGINNKQYDKEKMVPVFLRWKGDNQNVYVTGTFTGWGKKIPLNKSMNDFAVLINLPKGTHRFKFFVDNEWKCSDELAIATDSSGNLFNYIEVNEALLSPAFQNDKQSSLTEHWTNKTSEIYTNEIPAFLQTAVENGVHRILPESYVPPSLPPHLGKVILNSNSTMKDDQSILPNPNHVVLNHLAASSIRNGVLAVSVTTRFRNKYVTTVLYRPISV
ncbi:hypothetical protein PCK1_002565 [Pneumocystis canis]|nr:hypothetical protein PCK1_002565 [Pneumocystis canis]